MADKEYMRRALQLARNGAGWTSPNPMVGAVVVKEGRIVGEGWHRHCGGLHAEREALLACTEDPSGATMYVTLEPCCHHGRQPPCTEAILKSGIARVVVGSNDPNPLVGGKGISMLRERGVEVQTGVLKQECDALNRAFFHFITTGRPYVTFKYAMTMDGKIAAYTGASKWITGEEARARVHRDRHANSAIMVGLGTVLADDPLLTCRMEGGRNPMRVVCDSNLRTPLGSNLVKTADQAKVLIATCVSDPARHTPYEQAGCTVWTLPSREGRVDLTALMERLGASGVDSVLLEGGAELGWAALQAGVVQRVQAYVAPKLLGGAGAKGPVGGQGVPAPDQAFELGSPTVRRVGEDLLIESEVKPRVHRNR